jgi:hypothetical protein
MLGFRNHPEYPVASQALATSWTGYLAQAMGGEHENRGTGVRALLSGLSIGVLCGKGCHVSS